MKVYIRARIAAGDTKSEIKAKLVDQFGPTVLAVPPRKGFDWLAWLLPIGGLAVGAVVVGGLAWHWSRGRGDEPPPPDELEPLDPELERRLDAELARFE
jgi:cytochrome c-type biogenesis protein CcmH